MSHAHALGVIAALVLVCAGGCGDGASGGACVEPSRCTASPIGAWQHLPCAPWERLRFTTASASGTIRACLIELDEARVAETDRFDVAASGTFAREWSARGPWSGLVDPACLAAAAASCTDLAADIGYGVAGCEETPEGCRCAGTVDLGAAATGEWRTGSGQLVLEDEGGEETFNLCADERIMRLDPPGDRSRYYRPYVAPPAR